MKKITMSLGVSALLISGANAFETEAGTISGEVSAYTVSYSESEAGYTMGSGSLNFDSKDMNGFKASLGVMTNFDIAEQTDGAYGENEEDLMVNVANISYAASDFTVIAGRQSIDLEWIGDYHEALVGVYSGIPNTTLVAGYTTKTTGNGNDGALADFADIGENGAMVVDGTFKVNEDMTVGAYYMSEKDLFSAYGAKVETSVDGLAIVGKYAGTSEDVSGTEDGTIMALDLGYSMDGVSLGGGYIQTDKDGGIGSISTLGGNINPLDSGNQVYSKDASTLYASVGGTAGMFDLGAMYGSTSYGDYTESEIDLTASWECLFVKNLNLSALYATVSADSDDTAASDETYYSLQAAYSF